LTALIEWAESDFRYLLGATGLTKGNLSSHLGKLEAAGLIQVSKGFKDKTPWTRIMLTREGRARIQAHWEELEWIRRETMGLA
jgi:DNA-binding MarR family transcriptional regulator